MHSHFKFNDLFSRIKKDKKLWIAALVISSGVGVFFAFFLYRPIHTFSIPLLSVSQASYSRETNLTIAERINSALAHPRFSGLLFDSFVTRRGDTASPTKLLEYSKGEFIYLMQSDLRHSPLYVKDINLGKSSFTMRINSKSESLDLQTLEAIVGALNDTLAEINMYYLSEGKKRFRSFYNEANALIGADQIPEFEAKALFERLVKVYENLLGLVAKYRLDSGRYRHSFEELVRFHQDLKQDPLFSVNNVRAMVAKDFASIEIMLLDLFHAASLGKDAKIKEQLADLKVEVWDLKLKFQVLNFMKAQEANQFGRAVQAFEDDLLVRLPSFSVYSGNQSLFSYRLVLVQRILAALGCVIMGLSLVSAFLFFWRSART